MKRRRSPAVVETKLQPIIVYFPHQLIRLLDEAATKSKSDRNQFICAAVQEKIGG